MHPGLRHYYYYSSSSEAFDPSAESLAAFSNIETGSGETLTEAEKVAIDRFINEQVALGNWANIYSFIPFSGLSTAAKALVDWKTGVTATLHFQSGSNPTYAAATGFTTSGTNYIDSKVNPSTIVSGASVALNDSGYHLHIIENVSGTGIGFGIIGTTSTHQAILTVSGAGVASYKHHRSTTSTNTDTENLGFDDDFYSLTRISSIAIQFRKDCQNQTVITSGNTSAGVPAGRTITIGALNNNGTITPYGAGRYGTFMVNKAVDFENQGFFAHWEILMMELGVKTKSALYPIDLPEPSYSASDAMILNSEGQSNGMFCGGSAGAALAGTSELFPAMTGANVFWREKDINGNPTNPAEIQTLEYGVNNSYSTGQLDNYAAGLRAAWELKERQNLKLYIWHYCISGQGLHSGDTDGFHPDLVGEEFRNSHTLIGAGCLPLVSETIKKIVFHWSQGETDASDGRTTVQYRADFFYYLTKKIDFLEGQGINLTTTKFHVIVPKIYRTAPYVNTNDIRAAQDQFTIANFESDYPAYAGKITSMVVYDVDKLIHGDLVHTDVTGVMIEGYRVGMYAARL